MNSQNGNKSVSANAFFHHKPAFVLKVKRGLQISACHSLLAWQASADNYVHILAFWRKNHKNLLKRLAWVIRVNSWRQPNERGLVKCDIHIQQMCWQDMNDDRKRHKKKTEKSSKKPRYGDRERDTKTK